MATVCQPGPGVAGVFRTVRQQCVCGL